MKQTKKKVAEVTLKLEKDRHGLKKTLSESLYVAQAVVRNLHHEAVLNMRDNLMYSLHFLNYVYLHQQLFYQLCFH